MYKSAKWSVFPDWVTYIHVCSYMISFNRNHQAMSCVWKLVVMVHAFHILQVSSFSFPGSSENVLSGTGTCVNLHYALLIHSCIILLIRKPHICCHKGNRELFPTLFSHWCYKWHQLSHWEPYPWWQAATCSFWWWLQVSSSNMALARIIIILGIQSVFLLPCHTEVILA